MMHKKSKPKLLHITSSLKMGGAERVLVDLVGRLRDDYEHEIIFFYDGPHRAHFEHMGVTCRQVTGLVSLYDPVFWLRMVCAVKRANPACIHSMLWGANWVSRLLGKLLGVSVINGMHNAFDGYGRLRRLLDRLTLAWADYYVVVSDMVKDSCKRIYPSVRDERVVVIENGVSLQRGAVPPALRTELGIPIGAYVIGSVGRFEPEKNHELLVRAFALLACQVPQAYLLLVGYGSQESHLRSLVARLGLGDRMCFVIGEPAGAYYPLMDCFVLSSPREGLALALLEAMVHEIPCVVANLDGHHSALTNGRNGVLVDLYDEKSLAKAIVGLIKAPAVACCMGGAGKNLVEERYTVARMAASYCVLFDKCIEKNSVRFYGRKP